MTKQLYRLSAFAVIVAAYFLFYALDAHAIGIKQVQRESRPAKMTVISHCENNGMYSRSRSVRNWRNKCLQRKKARLRSTRSRRSQILSKPRLRISRSIRRTTYKPRTQKTERLSKAVRSQYRRPVRRTFGHYNPYYRPNKR